MWYTLLVELQQYLASLASLNGVVIQLGDSAKVPEVNTLVLLRGPTIPDERLKNVRGEQALFIESWVTSNVVDAEQSVLDGYQQLADLEKKLTDAIQAFGTGSNTIAGYHIRTKIKQFEPDGDAFRPTVASRLPITIHYTKINP